MLHLLNLLAAIALLVWGTQIVRTGVLRVFGESLRSLLSTSMGRWPGAMLAGMGVTCLVQSSTATSLIVASFVGKGLVSTASALVVMLGADIGTSLMAVVYSFDLSWLSPLLIFLGVIAHVSGDKSTSGRVGQVGIGLGLITLALQLIVASTRPLVESPVVHTLLVSIPNEILAELFVGALLAVLSYSSLAVVLLTATLAAEGMVPLPVALGLVLGANLGRALASVLSTLRSDVATRRLPMGNLVFKLLACLLIAPWLPQVHTLLRELLPTAQQQVVLFNLAFNVAQALLFVGFAGLLARSLERWMPTPDQPDDRTPRHLDKLALDTPSLALSCAAREALRQADAVETMLRGILPVIRHNDLERAEQLRRMDDVVDSLYTAIKLYLTQISRNALSERESRRWTEIVSFTINMEQIGDIIERVLQDIEDKKIRKNRRFSDAGMAEICHLHERLTANLRLGMSVFLDGHMRDAQRLLEEKARFRELEHEYAASHLARLQDNTAQSIETSSLHLDLISDLKRINSHICSIAYPILEAAGALTPTRLRASRLAPLDEEPH
ncbi:phosphate:Na+ symporter [Sphaerotilus hippei]|uniref:Phosphate:Na+ symporter n=1 Tax=Sphaerotilus hippei TaxID=744406 RepID=A0A318GXZ0_9BURK|nr:Na/Pi cotransporter family protein [Sphaerotilus hippei]PXW93410.1 phosphate:Na+ symporter [Sphaerotilus hippei]